MADSGRVLYKEVRAPNRLESVKVNGAESALDFNTLLPSTTGTYNPMARIAAMDNDGYSDNLVFQSNTPGAQNNGLKTNMFIGSNGEVGINTAAPGATLDVNGSAALRGQASLTAAGAASATAGVPSYPLNLTAQVYNSASKANVSPAFDWQAIPIGNNSASPKAALELLYSNGSTTASTGFSFNSNGTINFANGQTFPGAGSGTITGVTAGAGLTGGGTTGNVTLSLNTGTTDARYAQLKANNAYSGQQIINTETSGVQVTTQQTNAIYGELDGTGFETGLAIQGVGSNVEAGVYGSGDQYSFAGVMGDGNIGVYGHTSTDGIDADGTPLWYTAGVWAQATTLSATGSGLADELGAGLFADGGVDQSSFDKSSFPAIIAATDTNSAGIFWNAASSSPTLFLSNSASGGAVLQASGSSGDCGIDGSGNLACSGTLGGSNVTANARVLETYGVQAAENWYEDYGSGQLSGGAAHIDLDPDFGETVNTGVAYHVFLTPNGDCKGLYVANKTATGFEVRELGGGTASVAFDYKIVAKRKGYEQARLEDITEATAKRRAQVQNLHRKPAAGARPLPKPAHANGVPADPPRKQASAAPMHVAGTD